MSSTDNRKILVGPGGIEATTGTLSVNGNVVSNVADPSNPQDAVTLNYLASNYLNNQGGALSTVALGGGNIQLGNSTGVLQLSGSSGVTLSGGTGDIFLTPAAGRHVSVPGGTQLFLEQNAPIQFLDSTNSSYVGFQAPNLVTTSVIWNLPVADGSTNQVLATDGAGNLSWETVAINAANQQLSNLVGPTSINADLLPQSGFNLGSGAAPWGNAFLSNAQISSLYGDVGGAPVDLYPGLAVRGDGSFPGIQWYDTSTNTNYVALKSPAVIASSLDFVLPAADGSVGSVMATDGSGNLYWASPVASAANQTLSNLITTTAVNVDLLPAGDEGINLGSQAHRWDNVFTGAIVNNGSSLVLGAQFVAIQNGISGNPGQVQIYDGTNTNFLGFQAPATLAGTTTWTLPATDGSSGQVLTTDGAGNLSFASATATAANLQLSNLVGPTAINADLLPASSGSSNLGSVLLPWGTVYAAASVIAPNGTFSEVEINDGTNQYGTLAYNQTLPDGTTGVMVLQNDSSHPVPLGVMTDNDAASSQPLSIETGNALGGNSGNIKLQTGTATAGRGSIVLDAGTILANTSIVPNADLSYSLGASGATWAVAFAGQIHRSDNTLIIDVTNNALYDNDGIQALGFGDGNFMSLFPNGANGKNLRFYNQDTSAYVQIRADNATANTSYIWPVADGTVGQVMTTDGSGAMSWSSPTATAANLQLSNLVAPTAVSADLLPGSPAYNVGSTSLPWNNIVSGNVSTDNFYQSSGVPGGQIAVHTSLVPNVAGAYGLGSFAAPWLTGYIGNLYIADGTNQYGTLVPGQVLPDGTTGVLVFQNDTSLPVPLGVMTVNGTSSQPLSIETGNATAGNSGTITLQTGTASGGSGDITLQIGTAGGPGQINLVGLTNAQNIYPSGSYSLGYAAGLWSQVWTQELALTTAGTEVISGTTGTITVQAATEFEVIAGTIILDGTVGVSGNAIQGVLDPVNAQDAATKNYVDNAIIAAGPTWTHYTVQYSDLLTGSDTIFNLVAQGVIHEVVMKLTTGFASVGSTSYQVALGVAGDTAKYASAYECDGTANPASATNFEHTYSGGMENFGASTPILLTVVSSTNSPATYTAGQVEVYVLTSTLP